MASSTSRGVARTPGTIPPSRTARGITPGAQYALSPFVTDASLFRQLRAPPPPPLHACPELTRRRPRREPHAGSRGYRPAAAPPPPRPSSRGSARPAPARLPIMRMAAGPARGAHMLARRAGPCAAMARCPPPRTARAARGLADGSRVGAGEGRALLLVLEVRAGVEAGAAGAAGATQAWRAGEGCCQRWRRCSGLPPGSSRRLFPEAWLDPALAMTSSPPADELKQIRVILGLRSQGCYSPLPPGLKPTLS